ncbi:MAG: hypothetical protein AAGA67_04455 [Cyanobacteria bacterium P01_F01_bin.153]
MKFTRRSNTLLLGNLSGESSEKPSHKVSSYGQLGGKFGGVFQGIVAAGLATGIAAAIAPVASAHGALVEYKAINTPSGTAVQIAARYDTNEPMHEAQVSIYHPDQPQTPWLTGQTDANGHFEFTPDQGGNWDIKVRHAGHGALVTMEWPPETALAAKDLAALGSSSQGGLPQWLGLGLGVAGCLGGAWFVMRRSPSHISGVSGGVEIAD